MNLPIIIIGAGGHAGVLLEALQALGCEIIGCTDNDKNKSLASVKYLGTDEAILGYSPNEVQLVNGIGSVSATNHRSEIFQKFKRQHYTFKTIIHPSAIVAKSAHLGEGAQVMAGTVIQTNCVIGDNVLVNTGAVIDHDSKIGAHCHIASGATLSGAVTVGEQSHIGTGASIIQGMRIGNQSTIGAGAVVTENIPDNVTAIGVPAKNIYE